MGIENQSSTGFQPELVNLTEMKEALATSIFIGDGMSGKTQILMTLGKLLLEYMQIIYQKLSEDVKDPETDSSSISKSFLTWAKNNGFHLRYGKKFWDVLDVSIDTETIGLEDFEFSFPYIWQGQTYKIRLQGNDVGGQNIFDHFRAVLGKIVRPEDTIVVVFDKSRQLSCFNSIEQIKSTLAERSDFPQILYCGNKIDLEEHIQTPTWRDSVLKSIIEEIEKIDDSYHGEYSIPSLVGEKERIIKYKIENNKLSFPDLEAIVYNSIRNTDTKYGTNLMSEVNTKALSREIASQIIYNKKADEIGTQNEKLGELWDRIKGNLFQFRPLAIQYSSNPDDPDIYGKIREKWGFFGVELPILEELVRLAIEKAGCSAEILSDVEFFNTNALMGNGILEMINHIIQETLVKNETSQEKIKVRRQFRRF